MCACVYMCMHTCESVRACTDLPAVPSGGYPFDEVALLSEDGTTTHPLSETVSSDVCTAGRIAGNVYRGTRKLLGLLNIGDFFLAETALVIHTHTHERERERDNVPGVAAGDVFVAPAAADSPTDRHLVDFVRRKPKNVVQDVVGMLAILGRVIAHHHAGIRCTYWIACCIMSHPC